MHSTENVVSMWKDLRAISGGDMSRKLFKKYISSGGKSGISMEILMHHQSMTWLGDPSLQASLEIHSIFLRTYKRDASRCLSSVYPPALSQFQRSVVSSRLSNMAQTQKQWTVVGRSGFQDLKFDEKAPIPELGDKDVLVKCTYTGL